MHSNLRQTLLDKWQGACHCPYPKSSSTAKQLTSQTKLNIAVFWCKPLTFTCKRTDFPSQRSWDNSCTCMCTIHMQAPANMHNNAAHQGQWYEQQSNTRGRNALKSFSKLQWMPLKEQHLLETVSTAARVWRHSDASMYETADRTEACLPATSLCTHSIRNKGPSWLWTWECVEGTVVQHFVPLWHTQPMQPVNKFWSSCFKVNVGNDSSIHIL